MELFVTPTTAEQVERVSILKIYSFQQGNLSIRWQSPKPMNYQTQDINDFPLDQTTSSSNGWPPAFFTYRNINLDTNIVRTTTWHADDTGEIRVIGTMEAPSLEVLSVQPAQQVEDLCILVCV